MINDYVRKDLLGFEPYHLAKQVYDIKIDANENPYGHSPLVLSKIEAWSKNKDNLTRYPDTDATDLRCSLAKVHNVMADEVICGVGSDQLIELIIKVFIEPNDVVMVPNPSFSMYTLSAVLNHGKAIAYELNDDFDYDYDLVIERYKVCQPKLMFICTPNNPTGNRASLEGMKKILDNVKCPVIIDEAYEEFVNDQSMIKYIHEYPNLIVLRTFSKAYGLAGLRIGYAIAGKEMIDIIGIAKAPYSVSSFSQAVAGFILEDLDYYRSHAEMILSNKKLLSKALGDISFIERVFDSAANFILIRLKETVDAQVLKGYLSDNKILIRDYAKGSRLEGHMRITVGLEEENEALISKLKDFQ